LAKVTWRNGAGAEHLSIVTNQNDAREVLDLIGRDEGARVITCYVE
jgi:hypothetical protein